MSSMLEHIFGGTKQQQQPKPNPGETLPNPQATLDANGKPPAPTQVTPPAPMEKFKELWNPSKEAKANQFDPSTLLQIDPVKLDEGINGMDFVTKPSDEALTKMLAGGEEGLKEMMNLINSTARNVMSVATKASIGVTKTGITKHNSQLDGLVKREVKNQQSAAAILESNPALKNPAVRQFVDNLRQQVIDKNPDATTEEVSQVANEFLNEFAGLIQAPQRQQEANKSQAASDKVDWNKLMGIDAE